MENEYWEILGYFLEISANRSSAVLKKNSPGYQAQMTKLIELDVKYQNLEIEDEQRKNINELLSACLQKNIEETRISYLAGIIDCYKFLRENTADII